MVEENVDAPMGPGGKPIGAPAASPAAPGGKRTLSDALRERPGNASPGGGEPSKRSRLDPPGDGLAARLASPAGGGDEWDDDELIALAAEEAGPPALRAAAGTEDQELLRLALETQPQQQPQPWRSSGPGAVGGGGGGGGGDDDIDGLLDLMDEEDGCTKPAKKAAPAAPAPAPAAAPAAAPAPAPAPAAPRVDVHDELLPRRPYTPPAWIAADVDGECVSVTAADGSRVYCALRPPAARSSGAPAGDGADGGGAPLLDVAAALRRARGGLLPRGIAELTAEVEAAQLARALAETRAEARAAAAAAAPPDPAAEQQGGGGGGGGGAPGKKPPALWAQKYAPASFLELLSDEATNRDVVRWLKGWDPCVFGTPAPAPPRAAGAGGAGGAGGGARGPRAGQAPPPPQAPPPRRGAPDPLGRPEQRVILLAGPPGLGKTTLAHVAARHCGYRPLEINASDDRGGGALLRRVRDAVETASALGEARPTCLIVDEIDGAAGGGEARSAIAALLRVVNAAPRARGKAAAAAAGAPPPDADGSDSDDDGGGGAAAAAAAPRGGGAAAAGRGRAGGGGGGGRRALGPLRRPIIAICNDPWAPALRPLREAARVFMFRRPSAERLAQRLAWVCGREGLAAEKSTLRLLAERAECDVRCCLNTLQFVARRADAVRAADLGALAGVGAKDLSKGAFQVWGALLAPRAAGGCGFGGGGAAAEPEGARTSRLLGVLADFGDAELVLAGLHENLPSLAWRPGHFDLLLRGTAGLAAECGACDALLAGARRTGDYGLLKYTAAPLLQLAARVAAPGGGAGRAAERALRWPRAAADAARAAAANRDMLAAWRARMAPAAAAALAPNAAVAACELVPALLAAGAPRLRPVSRHLYSPAERAALEGAVATMLALDLRYAPAGEPDSEDEGEDGGDAPGGGRGRAPADGEPPLRFRPPVHRLGRFRGLPRPARGLPVALRQVVAHEVEVEAIRRAEAARRPAGAAGAGPAPAPAPALPAAAAGGAVPLTLAQRMAANPAAARAAAAAAAPAARRGTWLDAARARRQAARPGGGAAAAGAGAGGAGGGGARARPVLYRFNEGYTNAVKRPVLMRELLVAPGGAGGAAA